MPEYYDNAQTENLGSLEAAVEQAFANFAEDEVDVEEPLPVPDTQANVVQEEEAGEQVEEEEQVPTKLADLIKEDPPDEVAPDIKWDSKVSIPDVGEVTLAELRDGFLRRADYTQKTQEVAELRKANERAVSLFERLQNDTVGTVAQLAFEVGLIDEGKLKTVPRSMAAPKVTPVADEPDLDSLVAKKVEEVLKGLPQIKAIEEQQTNARVWNELDRIEHDYNVELDNDDKTAVIKYALKMGEPNLELAYLKLQRQLDEATQTVGRIKNSANRQKPGKAHAKEVTESPKTVQEAYQRAVAMLDS